MLASVTGSNNTALGESALNDNRSGNNNTASGVASLQNGLQGNDNSAYGFHALEGNSGDNNIAVGSNAGNNLTTGSNNIDIGAPGVAAESNKIRIGKQGTQNGTFIAGTSGTTVTGSQVVVNSNGKLGVAGSSARFQEAIKPMDKTSEAILSLEPMTFHYKKELDPDHISQFGLIAEGVEKVDPALVVRDDQGQPYTVRYDAVNAMLLNEFLKEHRKVEEQGRPSHS
jgi:Chaperone of endosialidase